MQLARRGWMGTSSLSLYAPHSAKPVRGYRRLRSSPAFLAPTARYRPLHHDKRPSRSPSILPPPPHKHASTSSAPPSSPLPPATYHPPTTGLLSHLPRKWLPYAELARLDKPTGTYYLFLPCLFSTLTAAAYTAAPPAQTLSTTLLFLAGALIMRSAGCTINDLWDRNLDPHVARTRLRPLARRALTPAHALGFAAAQCLAGLGVLLQFPPRCLYYGVPSLVLVGLYPLAKRVTHYPQVVLGLTFSWGAMMGFPALGVDVLAEPAAAKAVAALYASCVCWTVLYDMIYAHMDLRDDRKVGIKSIALRHEKETKAVLTGLAVGQVGLLAMAGVAAGAGPVFLVGSCGSAVVTLGVMIWRVKLKEVASCWWWFRNGVWFTGGGIALGMLGDYVIRLREVDREIGSQVGYMQEDAQDGTIARQSFER